MPFTFSHPAIILPLAYLPRKYISLTGLIVGSLTPDFEYFLRMKVSSIFSHTLLGLFWFNLPFGLLLTFIFHLRVKNDLIDNLPVFLKEKSLTCQMLNWNIYFRSNWFIVILSILVGAGSHLFWDAFTHDQGYFVKAMDGIRVQVQLFGVFFPAYKIFQHVSTLVGAAVILFAVCNTPTVKVLKQKKIYPYWFLVGIIATIIISLRIIMGIDWRFIGHLLVTAMSASLISLIIVPSFIKYNSKNLRGSLEDVKIINFRLVQIFASAADKINRLMIELAPFAPLGLSAVIVVDFANFSPQHLDKSRNRFILVNQIYCSMLEKEELYVIPARYRKIENLHIVFWLIKDLCWVMLWRPLGIIMILPTIGAAVLITWQTRHIKSELLHNIAVLFWITANAYWMITEFFFTDDTLRYFAVIPFSLGIIAIAYYYFGLMWTKNKG